MYYGYDDITFRYVNTSSVATLLIFIICVILGYLIVSRMLTFYGGPDYDEQIMYHPLFYGVIIFALAVLILGVLSWVCDKIDPDDVDFPFEHVEVSNRYVPDPDVLLNDEDMCVFKTYQEYYDWYLAKKNEGIASPEGYAYEDDQIVEFAKYYYYDNYGIYPSSGSLTPISGGDGYDVSVRLISSINGYYATYEINRQTLKGSDEDGNYIDLSTIIDKYNSDNEPALGDGKPWKHIFEEN